MKKSGLVGAIMLCVAFAPLSAAKSADYFPPPIISAATPPFVELGSNWYLRGDFAYRMYNDVSISDGIGSVTTSGPEDTAALGIGIGYKFNSWLRADLTTDYAFGSRFAPGTFGVGNAKLWSAATFANAYVDFGTWFGVTPYAGAGIGAAYNSLENSALFADEGRWNFAWAGMAGINYHVSANLSVDIGYRYVDLGQARGGIFTVEDVTAHEFRIGFRYLID